MTEQPITQETPRQASVLRWTEWLDTWMTSHPWHPRFMPFAVYGLFIPIIGFFHDRWPASYLFFYSLQCFCVSYLLWRYRRLLPELNFKFHWLAAPVGVGVFFAWVYLGKWTAQTFSDWLPKHTPAPDFRLEKQMGLTLGWTALVIRMVGMSIVVPLFEELFIRSLILRSFHSLRRSAIGIVQLIQDMPLIGDWLIHTDLGARAHRHASVFGPQFEGTPLGKLSITGVTVSTLIFLLSHIPRDYLGCIACGVSYCLLLSATRHKGLGPVAWAHGITNAMLWGYTLYYDDWMFL